MNSEVKSYDLTKPMKWIEFKALPNDLKKEYILRLQKLYNANDVALGEMFGVTAGRVWQERKRLGIPCLGKRTRIFPEWYNFLKYSTSIDAPREATPLKELISPAVKAKLAEYEVKHPPAIIAKTDSDTPIDTPIGATKPYGVCRCEEQSSVEIRSHEAQQTDRISALSYGKLCAAVGALETFSALKSAECATLNPIRTAARVVKEFAESVEVYV